MDLIRLSMDSWTPIELEHNVEVRQLCLKCMTQGSREHICFLNEDQSRFSAHSSSPHIACQWCSYQTFVVASQQVGHWPITVAILEPHENHEWRSGYVR
jgi:hypothetical protein